MWSTNHIIKWLQQHLTLCSGPRLGASSNAGYDMLAPAILFRPCAFGAAVLCRGLWLEGGPLLAAHNPSPTLRKTVDHTRFGHLPVTTNLEETAPHYSGKVSVYPGQPRFSTLCRFELASSHRNPCVSGTPSEIHHRTRSRLQFPGNSSDSCHTSIATAQAQTSIAIRFSRSYSASSARLHPDTATRHILRSSVH